MKIHDLNDTDREVVADDLEGPIVDHFGGMLDGRAARFLANDVINILDELGWLIEPPQCEHREHDTNALDCERILRPGQTNCDQH